MADTDDTIGRPYTRRKPRSPVRKRYFFVDDKLYRTDYVDRAQNIMRAWDFQNKRIVEFVLTDVKRRMKNAYTTAEVAEMLNRNRVTIQGHVVAGHIKSPYRIYAKGMNASGKPFDMMIWTEEDILGLHSLLLVAGNGRPPKNGQLKSAINLPTRKEVLAILKEQPTFYMHTTSGELVPVWRAYDEI